MTRRRAAPSWMLTGILLALIPQIVCQVASAASASSSSSPTTTTKHKTQTVTVGVVSTNTAGAEVHSYQPNRINAAIGDTIVFAFLPGGHAVIRAEYTDNTNCPNGYCNPCAPWESYHPNQATLGFASGNFYPTDNSLSQTWNLTLTDNKPIFLYCNATRSCSPGGMVGVINGDESVDLTAQIKAAQDSPYQLSPGQALPSNFTVNPNTVNSTSTSDSTSNSTTNQSSTTNNSNNSSSGLSGGAIAGIAVGAIFILLLAAALFYFVGRNKTLKDEVDHHREGGSQFGGSSNAAPLKPSAWSPAMSQQAHNIPPFGSYHTNRSSHQQQQQNHRVSGTTYYSHGATSPILPDQSTGQFIGYNRQTGAPEFAAEAEAYPPHPSRPSLGGAAGEGRYESARISMFYGSDAGGGKSPSSPRVHEQQGRDASLPWMGPDGGARGYTEAGRRATRTSHFGELMGDVPPPLLHEGTLLNGSGGGGGGGGGRGGEGEY